MNNELIKEVNTIKKHYKNTKFILDILITNYHGFNIYIRLDYYKKLKCYRLSWLDLAEYKNNFDAIVSYEFIPDNFIYELTSVISNIKSNEENTELEDNYLVEINSDLKIADGSYFSLSFNRFIPNTDKAYLDIIMLIFNNLPKKLSYFSDEITASFFDNEAKYIYQDEIAFDLFNDEIDKLFSREIIDNGTKYFDEGRVFFLEKIGNTYYSVVGGKSLYVVTIRYDQDKHMMRVYCSCPNEYNCKHICAVVLAIRNQKFRNFYKITHKNKNSDLFNQIVDFNFLLCIGIDDQNSNYLVIQDGIIKILPIKNDKNEMEWTILEDDENNTLTKRIASI